MEINRRLLAAALGVAWVPMPGEPVWFSCYSNTCCGVVHSWEVNRYHAKPRFWIPGGAGFMELSELYPTKEAAEAALAEKEKGK